MKHKLFLTALVAAVTVPVAVAPVHAEAKVFTDVSPANPYFDIIHDMRDKNIITGYEDGTFRPNDFITRKHAAALVSRTNDLSVKQPFVKFKDISEQNPYFNDIKKLQQAGIFEPDSNGNYNPNKPINRAEMAKVLTIAFDLKATNVKDFSDVPKSHSAYEYVRALYSNGITTGDNGLFKPDSPLTRAHYAVFMQRAMNYQGDKLTIDNLESLSNHEILALSDQELAQLILPFTHEKPILPKGVLDGKRFTEENQKKFNQLSVQLGSDAFLSKKMGIGSERSLQMLVKGWSENLFDLSPKEVIQLINKVYTEGIVISSNDTSTRKPLTMFFDYETGHMKYSVNNWR